jgi:cysteinyl-tRNA synthetase
MKGSLMSTGAVRLYNTMTQRVEPLEPAEPGHVRVYVCGLTTYDHAHAGHARTLVAFDVLVRFLRARNYRVTFVRNVTDVDDKILKRAAERGESPLALSERMSRVNADELRACGCLDPDLEPRVSESVPAIVRLIEQLVAREAAYVAETDKGRDVYFAVRAFPGYGKLSHRNVDDLVSGARVEPGDIKRDPLDFALWKASGDGGFGWDSPWGKGRPGWHIECSAMAAEALTPHFDVHGGGMDLIFPHHENEIAQSEAAWGEPFARLWMHSGFVKIDAEKMSKSLGNFVTIAQILERNDGEALRYFLLGAHYRVPIDFDLEKRPDGRVVFPGVDEAERRVDYLYATRETLAATAAGAKPAIEGDTPAAKTVRSAVDRVLAALDNDLNTSVALSILAELAPAANDVALQVARAKKDAKAVARGQALAAAALEAIDACCRPMGLLQTPAPVFFARTQARRLGLRGMDAADVESKVRDRAAARAAKDFAKADGLRAELTEMGIEIQDVSGGDRTTWRVLV